MRRLCLSIILLIYGLSFLFPTDNNLRNGVSIIRYMPGLFQLKEKKVLKGSILLSSFIIGISGAIINNNSGNKYYKMYLLSKNVDEIVNLRKKSENKFKSRNLFIIGTGISFLLHLIDMKFSKGKGKVKSEIKNNNINIGIYYNF
jgi:hypothetical protein